MCMLCILCITFRASGHAAHRILQFLKVLKIDDSYCVLTQCKLHYSVYEVVHITFACIYGNHPQLSYGK